MFWRIMKERTAIELWDDNGACAGQIAFDLRGCKENTIFTLNLQIAGLDNFKMWLEKAKQEAIRIVCTEAEYQDQQARESDAKP